MEEQFEKNNITQPIITGDTTTTQTTQQTCTQANTSQRTAGSTYSQSYNNGNPINNSQTTYTQGAYGRNQYYQNSPKQKQKKSGGRFWAKVVCGGLVFGLLAGGTITGIQFAGQALMNNNGTTTLSNGNSGIGVVKTSSTNVETIEAQGVSDIVKEAIPSIVSVNTVVQTTSTDYFGRTYSQEGSGAGSGIIFSEQDGLLYLLTNYHVVEDSKSIEVTFADESSAKATVLGYDADADVAVLTVDVSSLPEETKNAIKVAVLGDSSALEAGDGAIAIGNALGYGQSVTTGAISAVERTVQLTDGAMTLIQTSAAINPGNSGGALLNTKGEVIGINTVKYSDTTVEGMGFAIPINSALETANAIISGEIVNRSDADTVYLGIRGGTLTQEAAQRYNCPQGVYISSVYSGSAAQRAGIEAGYIITSFNETTVTTMEELQECLSQCRPGDIVQITVAIPSNDGSYNQQETLTTILGSMDEAPEE